MRSDLGQWGALDDGPLDQVVVGVYEAAVGARPWRDACDLICDAFDLWSVQLLGVYKATGAMAFSFEGGRIAPEAALLYVTDYHAINPRLALARLLNDSNWIHDHEHLNQAFVDSDRFFQEFLLPYGGRWMSVTRLLDEPQLVVFFCLHRSIAQIPLSDAQTRTVDLVRHHIVSALRLHLERTRTAPKDVAGHALLELLAHAVCVVDESMLLRYANASADALIAENGPLTIRDGHLDGVELAGSRNLVAAVHALGLGGSLVGPNRLERAATRLPAVGNRPEHLVLAIAARPEATMASFGDTSCAVLIVHPIGGGVQLDPLVVAMAHGLTPGEAKVAVAIATGLTLHSIAILRGVTLPTVRAQLRSVFDKLGVHRQTELVARLLELPRLGHSSDQVPEQPDAPGTGY